MQMKSPTRYLMPIATLLLIAQNVLAQDYSAYLGVYQSEPDPSSYIQVKEQDGKLYFYTTEGVMEAKLHTQGDYELIHYFSHGEFNDLKQGQYQQIVNQDYATRVRYQRVNDTSILDLSNIHHGHLHAESIGTDFQCENEFPFELTGTLNETLSPLWKDINSGRYGRINSVLVAKDGKLLAEKYFNGFNHEEKQTVQSVSKSIISLLTGSALEEGDIESIQNPISKYFPQYKTSFSEQKQAITIQHLLTMKAGWEWDETSLPYTDAKNSRTPQMAAEDTIKHVLDLPLSHSPGDFFVYSGGVVDVMAELIKNATNSPSTANYFKQSRLAPLCIKNASLFSMADGRAAAGGGMLFRPRDMLKFGQLVLNDGRWGDQQLLSKAWIKESTQGPLYPYSPNYAYYWWNDVFLAKRQRHPAIIALGWGDQSIVVFKELNLVIVTTGYNFERDFEYKNIVQQHILPAVLESL
ncbi:TPA: class C beta-lactamase-related serine hydrolase [Vibrio vulnificus]|nr:serine hydrolase [Vibrio vulnificus]HAS8450682.1 class C beta-lactamase-related serine hydrolase [Vibrio vulnificus]